MSSFNERYALFLKEEGLRNVDVQKALNVSSAVASQWRTGATKMSNTTAELFCSIYNVNKEWLLDGVGEMRLPKTKSQTIADITATLYKADESSVTYKFITDLSKYVTEMGEEQLTLVLEKLREILNEVLDDEDKEKDSTE